MSQLKLTAFYATRKSSRSRTKVTSFYECTKQNIDENQIVSKNPDLSTCCEEVLETTEVKDLPNDALEIFKMKVLLQASPKRNLTNSNEGTPPKKKLLTSNIQQESSSPSKYSNMTPRKLFTSSEASTSDTLNIEPKVNTKVSSQETQKAIANFKEKIAYIKSYETNPYKVTAVISPSEECEKKSALPAVPAYQRYSYLTSTESFTLPLKYKLLSEMFRSMDTVISILNNRKEKCTFEKVKEGVQKMMKRTYSKSHLGQIVTVMPSAYDIKLEKSTYKKVKEPDYELLVNPTLKSLEGNKSKSKAATPMTPQDLMDRRNEFNQHLLNIVKNHHKVFLSRINITTAPTENIKRWHPKFQLDSVPEIESASLPEPPETKISTAKDVLNKIVKGSLRNKSKVVKALQSVSDESTPTIKKSETESPVKELPTTKSALTGICSDLIAKVRAKESAKLLECMTESPDAAKKRAMRERLPKIVQILWHYFIAERKAAVPIDTAVEKIIHSCGSLSTHEDVKAHLTLITETFPGWISFIQIPKGLYISMEKNKNINQMLDNFRC